MAGATKPVALRFFDPPSVKEVLSIDGDNFIFDFLNLKSKYTKKINWNEASNDRLWNYNMQYCDFLRQNNLKIETRAGVLLLLYEKLWCGEINPEPYPASLRIMNVIRFLSTHPEEQIAIRKYLHAEVHYLSKNLEYHLLGNHLLENAFALMMGGYFFDKLKWIEIGHHLVQREMEEQILPDGAHFELSPMYHQIILFRVLEAIYYLPNDDSLRQILIDKAEKMIAWLSNMTFQNGSVPHFNDSTEDIAYTTKELMQIAREIGISAKENLDLKDSGYRKFDFDGFEMVMDVYGIGPKYQPGHAHADTFTFFLSYNGVPIIVEPGISTYNIGLKRDWERSTAAHNTVSINGQNSSETWSGFRVGRRARVKINEEDQFLLGACHDGYSRLGMTIHRRFSALSSQITIEDYLEGWRPKIEAISYLHFHPKAEVQLNDRSVTVNDLILIDVIGGRLSLEQYDFSHGYNRTEAALRLRIAHLEPACITQIQPLI